MLAEQTDQNWKAYLNLSLELRADVTRMIPQKRFGPLTVQRPFYPEQDTCHVYLLHPPGGIVGGDELELIINSEQNSQALITTPGATKFYRSSGKTAQFKQTLNLADNASLEFLPLENIYFPGALVNAQCDIHLKNNSQLIYWETHCFGRPANNELFDTGNVIIKLNIYDENGLMLSDKQTINEAELKRSCGIRNYAVVSNMVMVSSHLTEDLITSLRAVEIESGYSGITQLNEKLLVIRTLTNSTLEAANYLQTLWTIARPSAFQRNACPPRIWNT